MYKKYFDNIDYKLNNNYIDCLNFACNNGYLDYCNNNAHKAVSCGHLYCLKNACENGYKLDKSICYIASLYGYLDCLIYARENKCDWNTYECKNAVMSWSLQPGHMSCLKYIYDNEYDDDRFIEMYESYTDYLDITYLIKKGNIILYIYILVLMGIYHLINL